MPDDVKPSRVKREKLSLCCAVLLFSAWAQAEQPYDGLVERARAGDYAPALSFLRQQQGAAVSPRYFSDHLLIAGWAGEDVEVTRLYERRGAPQDLSAEVLATVARAYRNQQRWPEALVVYRQALQRYPDHQVLLLGQVMTLADAGQAEAAIAQGRALVAQAPNDVERRLALGYAYRRNAQPYAALNEVDRAHDLAPEQSEVTREYLLTLQQAGLPEPALLRAQRHPGLLNPAQIRQLQADAVAEKVRLAYVASRGESQRFLIADRALADAERLLQDWATDPQAQADVRRVRIDRLGALHARYRMSEVVSEYQQLRREHVAVPDYALRWVASALLYLRQPEQAVQLYRQVIAGEDNKHPQWLEDHRGLFYALVETEQREEAQQLAEQLAGPKSPQLFRLGNPEPEPNSRWLEAQELLVAAALQVNDIPAAEQALTELVDSAPGNTALRTSLASVYLTRGWARRAEDELKVAESTTPRQPALEVEQGLTALELQEWRQLDVLADDMIQRYPESLQAQRLERLREVHHMAELRVSGHRGLGSSGNSNNTVSGGNDLGIDSVLYSPPLNDDWRVFTGAGYATGDFDEGNAQHRWQRAGVEWRVRNHTLEAELSNHDFEYGDELGARLSGQHDLNDYWQYGWSAEYLSSATPLRALNSDITSNSVSGYVRWRGDERREWRLAAAGSHFSDGNDRYGLLLDGRQRLYTAVDWQADLGLEVGTSHNSGSTDVPYFNPKSGFTVLPTLQLSHILYRRYQTVWRQHGQIGAGSYSQQDFGTDPIGFASYGQRLSLDDRFDAGVTVSALTRPYDGDREHEYELLFDINYRF